MNKHDINGAKAVLRQLWRRGFEWRHDKQRSTSWQKTYDAIHGDFRTISNLEEVEATLLNGRERDGRVLGEMRNRCILLAPPRGHSVVCFLGARWMLCAERSEMSLYLDLFGESQDVTPPWYRGYRLELPHGPGTHNYTHVQPVNAAGWQREVTAPSTGIGVPDDFPAFPVRGRSLTTLCAALAIALSGTKISRVIDALQGSRMRGDVLKLLC